MHSDILYNVLMLTLEFYRLFPHMQACEERAGFLFSKVLSDHLKFCHLTRFVFLWQF